MVSSPIYMETRPIRRNLRLSAVIQQGGFYRPPTTQQFASKLHISGKFVRENMQPDGSFNEEKAFETRNGLALPDSQGQHNAFRCIKQQKKLIKTLKMQITHIDKAISQSKISKYREIEGKSSIFLTDLNTSEHLTDKFPSTSSISTKFQLQKSTKSTVLPQLHRSQSVIPAKNPQLASISTNCDSISSSISFAKSQITSEIRDFQAKFSLNRRHLEIMEIEKRRWKYFHLRKTFEEDLKRHFQYRIGGTGVNMPKEMQAT